MKRQLSQTGMVLVAAIGCLFAIQTASAAGFTIDHNAVTEFDEGIPDAWIDAAKELVVVHTGQSHGRQVPYGLMDIALEIDPKYEVSIVTAGVPADTGALRVMRWLDGVGYMVDTDDYWEITEEVGGIDVQNVRNTLDLHAANGLNVDVILHTWSWDFYPGDYNENRINEYLAALEMLELEYPDTHFIYMTDTSDATGAYGDSRWLSHEQIRRYVRENDKILFDYGELETWSPDLSAQHTYFSSTLGLDVPVCAPQWECGGSGYVGQTGEGGSHINKAGATMKAKAFWVLLARIAGWDGGSQFDDVPTSHWAYSFIETLANSGITAGCGVAIYCPGDPVTRAQMAVFLERGINGANYNPPAASGNVFLDVGAGDFAAAWIEQLFADGITAGCGNNNYCANAEVTRDQMAVFLLRAKYGSGYSPPAPTGVFTDVDLSHWACAWIEQLAAEGITAGCGGGNYCPEADVTRDQMAVFLVRTFGL